MNSTVKNIILGLSRGYAKKAIFAFGLWAILTMILIVDMKMHFMSWRFIPENIKLGIVLGSVLGLPMLLGYVVYKISQNVMLLRINQVSLVVGHDFRKNMCVFLAYLNAMERELAKRKEEGYFVKVHEKLKEAALEMNTLIKTALEVVDNLCGNTKGVIQNRKDNQTRQSKND